MWFKYKVNYYSSYDDEEKPDEGIVYAADYSTAIRYVVEDYGEDAIVDVYLRQLCIEDGVRSLSKEDIDYAFKYE